MVEIVRLSEAVKELVSERDKVILEGFTHLIPYAVGHEIIRQGIDNLVLIKMTPDIICDQIIGCGLVDRLQFSWGGNPGVGSLHRFRDAVENNWPKPITLSERSHADMAAAYSAGASKLPFGILRGYVGTDLPKHNNEINSITCPYTGEELAVVPAIKADVTAIHAQRADPLGNVQLWGIKGVQKEAVMCSEKVIITVEEIVDKLTPVPNSQIIPSWLIDAVCLEPRGAYPSYALDYNKRDNQFYKNWDLISRDRDKFNAWIDKHIKSTENFPDFMRSIQKELVY